MTRVAASGASLPRMRSDPSTRVTSAPRRAKAWASSHPIGPPPSTARRPGSARMSHRLALVSTRSRSRPGIGGTTGCAPVASRACRNRTRRPSTSAVSGPVSRAVPASTCTPAASRAAGESVGAMLSIAPCTWAITRVKSTVTPPTSTPRRPAVRAPAAACPAARRDLDGTHPVHRQSPPVRSRSTSSTRAPRPAAVLAPTRPAVPPPSTSRSQGSSVWGVVIGGPPRGAGRSSPACCGGQP